MEEREIQRDRKTERGEVFFFFLKHRSSDSLGPRYTSVQRQRQIINKDFNKVTRDIESLGSLRTERLRH